jgi:hypothetical protein
LRIFVNGFPTCLYGVILRPRGKRKNRDKKKGSNREKERERERRRERSADIGLGKMRKVDSAVQSKGL